MNFTEESYSKLPTENRSRTDSEHPVNPCKLECMQRYVLFAFMHWSDRQSDGILKVKPMRCCKHSDAHTIKQAQYAGARLMSCGATTTTKISTWVYPKTAAILCALNGLCITIRAMRVVYMYVCSVHTFMRKCRRRRVRVAR